MEAIGSLAAHSVRAGGVTVKKGSFVSAENAARLAEAGIATIVTVRLEPGDIGEDAAALRLAQAIAGEHVAVERPFTGRSNLHAREDGILIVDQSAVDRINAVDEAITVATLSAYKPIVAGEMVGTVKIIPYGVQEGMLNQAVWEAGNRSALRIAPYVRRRIAVVSTMLPGLKPSVIDKTIQVLSKRLEPAGAAVVDERRVAHAVDSLAASLPAAATEADLVIVFGASAIADRRDVIPAAIEQVGGVVEHFGMPVDPGNLLLLGSIEGTPVIGAPGCARSPKENGFDWVLQRLLAGIPVTRSDITGLGVGGLLMEIVSRPQPRAGGESEEE
jgi:molybdenum cofactor cytidylyltransferase